MHPQENPCRVLLGVHGNSNRGLFLKNLYCLECTHFHLCPIMQVLIFTWVKWSIWGLSAVSKDTTSKQCPKIERGQIWYLSENPAQSRVRDRTAGKAPRSNHCASLSSGFLHTGHRIRQYRSMIQADTQTEKAGIRIDFQADWSDMW